MAKPPAYYNEFDPGAAAWLRELIAEGLIAPGDVDERSIKDVRADDLKGYAQCHFFAGIGVWSLALRSAGWPDDRPVWTGSCPCQPFSQAGKGLGFADPRHLWPDWFRLIAERGPDAIFGEQSSAAGLWVDLVRADLEALGAAFGCPDLPAAGFAQGAHIRQRLYWVADLHNAERWADLAGGDLRHWPKAGRVEGDREPGASGAPLRLADSRCLGDERGGRRGSALGAAGPAQGGVPQWEWGRTDDRDRKPIGGLGDAGRWGSQGRTFERCEGQTVFRGVAPGAGEPEWVACRDGLWRPIEPGSTPLANEAPGRVGRLRGYGNALDFQTALNFVAAFMDAAGLTSNHASQRSAA